MRYVESRCKQFDREETYRIYVTEALKLLSGLNKHYYDLVKPGVEETRSADEIVSGISAKLSKLGEQS